MEQQQENEQWPCIQIMGTSSRNYAVATDIYFIYNSIFSVNSSPGIFQRKNAYVHVKCRSLNVQHIFNGR